MALSIWIRPAPAQASVCGGFASVRFDGIGEAVDSRRSFIASAVSFVFPLACIIKAAEPATSGAGRKAVDERDVEEGVKGNTDWTCWSLVI